MATQTEENLDDVIADLVDGGESDNGSDGASPFDGIDTQNNTVESQAISLTERAAQQVRKILNEQEQAADLYLRVAVEGGGCSGLSYKLGLDHKDSDDKIIESQGLEVIVDSKHMMYLEGISIDYPDGLDARGFTFDNPNANETCGCGSSFAT